MAPRFDRRNDACLDPRLAARLDPEIAEEWALVVRKMRARRRTLVVSWLAALVVAASSFAVGIWLNVTYPTLLSDRLALRYVPLLPFVTGGYTLLVVYRALGGRPPQPYASVFEPQEDEVTALLREHPITAFREPEHKATK